MSDLRKAAEMALEAFEMYLQHSTKEMIFNQISTARAEQLRQALAESANSTTDFVEPKALAQLEHGTESDTQLDKIVELAIQGHASTRDAIRWAMQQEREACAKVCEEQITGYHFLATHGHFDHMDQAATNCAAAIRARGEK